MKPPEKGRGRVGPAGATNQLSPKHPRRRAASKSRGNDVASGFRRAAAVLAQLRAGGAVCAVFAVAFDEELREQVEAAMREKLLARRREQIEAWTDHARRLAGEFADSGDWRSFRALLRHVIAMRRRLENGGPQS